MLLLRQERKLVDPNYSLLDSFDYFRSQSNLSDHTLLMYSYALQHFFAFLEGSRTAEPLSIAGKNAPEQPLARLGASRLDVNILSWFVNYLGKEAKSAKPHRRKAGDAFRLEPSSVRLYGQAIVTWFTFLADEFLLPDRFPASAAISRAQRTLRTYVPATIARDGAVEPPEGLETVSYTHLRAHETR